MLAEVEHLSKYLSQWVRKPTQKTEYTVGDVLRKYLPAYEKKHALSYQQRCVVNDLMRCRTPQMGGVLRRCDVCKHWDFQYRSCKNRHCPNCGAFEKAQWLEAQKRWLLPIHYYHVVFTVDHVFNPLIWRNPAKLYNHLMQCAAQVMKTYGKQYLGGDIGFSMVLHTWGQTLQAHPHVHLMVTGGALSTRTDGNYTWRPAHRRYLFPVKQLSKDFQALYCASIEQQINAHELDTNGLDTTEILRHARSQNWEVYIQAPIYGPEKLLDYLARYIFRIAISNHRLVNIENNQIAFTYFDNRQGGTQRIMHLPAETFIQRFLSHILPEGFVRIRHYGLHHGTCRPKLQHARRLLGLTFAIPEIPKLKLLDWLKKILNSEDDPRRCPHCKQGLLLPVREFSQFSLIEFHLLKTIGILGKLLHLTIPIPTIPIAI